MIEFRLTSLSRLWWRVTFFGNSPTRLQMHASLIADTAPAPILSTRVHDEFVPVDLSGIVVYEYIGCNCPCDSVFPTVMLVVYSSVASEQQLKSHSYLNSISTHIEWQHYLCSTLENWRDVSTAGARRGVNDLLYECGCR
jgi:hypothetical protein